MALRTPVWVDGRPTPRRPLSRAGASGSGVLRGAAEPTWSDGAFVGFVIGAAFVGALWMLNWSLRGRRRDDYIDPYENVPYDDEEPSEEEMRQVAESMAEIARGELIPAHLVLPRRRASA